MFNLIHKRKFVALVISAAMFVSACSGMFLDPTNYEDVKNNIHITRDGFQGTVQIQAREAYNNWPYDQYFLRSSISSSQSFRDDTLIQIYVIADFSDWAFLDSAYSEGKRYPVTEIDRDVSYCSSGGCSVKEHIAVNLTLGQIKNEVLKKEVFRFKLRGNAGSKIISVPKAYSQAFVDAVEEYNSTLP